MKEAYCAVPDSQGLSELVVQDNRLVGTADADRLYQG